jgi:hypothetical protein
MYVMTVYNADVDNEMIPIKLYHTDTATHFNAGYSKVLKWRGSTLIFTYASSKCIFNKLNVIKY